MVLLRGKWSGKLNTPGGELALTFRFDRRRDEKFSGFIDIPDQNRRNLPITDIFRSDSHLSFKVPRLQATYLGTLERDRLQGTWKQRNSEQTLSINIVVNYPTDISVLNRVIGIRSVKGEHYVRISDDTSDLISSSQNNMDSEKNVFIVEDAGYGSIALKSKANGNYVVAERGGREALCASRTKIGAWERFEWVVNNDKTFSLRAGANNKFVTLQENGNFIANSVENTEATTRFLLLNEEM